MLAMVFIFEFPEIFLIDQQMAWNAVYLKAIVLESKTQHFKMIFVYIYQLMNYYRTYSDIFDDFIIAFIAM